jgi:hypothetical protein
MLEACQGEWGTVCPPRYSAVALSDLCSLIDRLAAAAPLSSRIDGASGDHAWISVIDRGFVLHAYFGENCRADGIVGFELYGPYPPGTECEHGDPYDGRGLAGRMTTACLKAVLSLLDKGHSPVDYVRGSALSVSVVADD